MGRGRALMIRGWGWNPNSDTSCVTLTGLADLSLWPIFLLWEMGRITKPGLPHRAVIRNGGVFAEHSEPCLAHSKFKCKCPGYFMHIILSNPLNKSAR